MQCLHHPRPWTEGSSAPVLCWILGWLASLSLDGWLGPEITCAVHLSVGWSFDHLPCGVLGTLQVYIYLLRSAQQCAFLLKFSFVNDLYYKYLSCLDLSVCYQVILFYIVCNNCYFCYYITLAYRRVMHVYRRAQKWTFAFFFYFLTSVKLCTYLFPAESFKLSPLHDYTRVQYWTYILYYGAIYNTCYRSVTMFVHFSLHLCMMLAVLFVTRLNLINKDLPHRTALGNKKLGLMVVACTLHACHSPAPPLFLYFFCFFILFVGYIYRVCLLWPG